MVRMYHPFAICEKIRKIIFYKKKILRKKAKIIKNKSKINECE